MARWEYALVRRHPNTLSKKSGGTWLTREDGTETRVADGFLAQDVHKVLVDLGSEGFELTAVEVHERPTLDTTYWLKRPVD